jgi:hypothetical protein
MVLNILEKYFKISNIKNEDQVSKIKNLNKFDIEISNVNLFENIGRN